LYRIPQFFDPLHIHPLAMLFGTVNSHEQVCDQASKDLDHNSISASRNEMVNVETLFPLSKEFLNFPSQLVDGKTLLQIMKR
jgi:hypothetical protein